MPKLNRIYSFVAVGFVLLFLGKISKVGLYTAYFKTIADVEIRNTQGLETEALPLQVIETQEAPLVEVPTVSGTALLATPPSFTFQSPQLALSLSLVQDLSLQKHQHFLVGCPVRGPDFS